MQKRKRKKKKKKREKMASSWLKIDRYDWAD